MDEDMQLAVPQIGARIFIADPIDISAKPLEKVCPGHGALPGHVLWMGVDPMLKSIDSCDPGENGYNTFQVGPPRSLRFGPGIEPLKKLIPQQFHAHRGHLTELYRRGTVGI